MFGIQLGGGRDINQAVACCQELIKQPSKAHLILLADLHEGGDSLGLLRRLAALTRSGVGVVVLLALTDQGNPEYSEGMAGQVVALGIPTFGCTPDQFPDLMAKALRRDGIAEWTAQEDIRLVRPGLTLDFAVRKPVARSKPIADSISALNTR